MYKAQTGMVLQALDLDLYLHFRVLLPQVLPECVHCVLLHGVVGLGSLGA